MTTSEINAAIASSTYAECEEIRKALDERSATLKSEFMAQCEAMGIECRDGNRKPRKARVSKTQQE